MPTMRSVDVDQLKPQTVILVDTEDEYLKIILDESESNKVYISNLDSNETETPRGAFIITNITVGQSLCGLAYPEPSAEDHSIININSVLETKPVTLIDVYMYEK